MMYVVELLQLRASFVDGAIETNNMASQAGVCYETEDQTLLQVQL